MCTGLEARNLPRLGRRGIFSSKSPAFVVPGADEHMLPELFSLPLTARLRCLVFRSIGRASPGVSQAAQLTPWCYLASEASAHVTALAWPLRTLLYLLVERVTSADQRVLLGQSSRRLLQYALGQPDQSSQLASAAIGFVADTYASDPAASRRSLERLLTPDRLLDHAHANMPSRPMGANKI